VAKGFPKGVWVARAPASHRPLHAKNPPPPLPVGGGAGGLYRLVWGSR
jgi:hypothetical protein